jgi:hypothetical protein
VAEEIITGKASVTAETGYVRTSVAIAPEPRFRTRGRGPPVANASCAASISSSMNSALTIDSRMTEMASGIMEATCW